VVVLDMGKMVYETGSAKMYLTEQEVAEAEVVDIAHNQDSWLMDSDPPARVEVGQVAGDIGHKPLQVYTVHNN
jgi:hypothetical protein